MRRTLTDSDTHQNTTLLGARVRVLRHVVYRSFPAEMVMLNLGTGTYHGLNATAGRMLEMLQVSDTVAGAAARLMSEFPEAREAIEGDLCALARTLIERGLLEIDGVHAD